MVSETTHKLPTARQALEAYGFKRNAAGTYVMGSGRATDAWQPAEGGWLLLQPPRAPIASLEGAPDLGSEPWGKALDGTAWLQVPWRQAEAFAGASGLHPSRHPQCFEWVWPDEAVAEMYAYADLDGTGNKWERQPDGSLAQAAE